MADHDSLYEQIAAIESTIMRLSWMERKRFAMARVLGEFEERSSCGCCAFTWPLLRSLCNVSLDGW